MVSLGLLFISCREDQRAARAAARDADIEERRKAAVEDGKRDVLARIEKEQAFFRYNHMR